MKKGLRNLIVIAFITILTATIVYAATWNYVFKHTPSWSVGTAIEVQYPVGTPISAGSSPSWGTVYAGANARNYRVINRSTGAIKVDISKELAPTGYALTHNVTSPFNLTNNGDFKDIQFVLTVPEAYGPTTNNCTIEFTVTGS